MTTADNNDADSFAQAYVRDANAGAEAELQGLSEGGSAWLVRKQAHLQGRGLPFDVGLDSLPVPATLYQPKFAARVTFPVLTEERIVQYTNSYFSTFNTLYPVLEQNQFEAETLTHLRANGFGHGEASSVLALLVFALGELALASVSGPSPGSTSGIHADASGKPPGLKFFNEARARLGSIPSDCELEQVQILLLQASYFQANACHLQYWRSTTAASMVCQVLVAQPPHARSSSSLEEDMFRRAFWMCTINEDLYHYDLDLPTTNIRDYEGRVEYPTFEKAYPDHQSFTEVNFESMPQYHFLAKASLKKVIMAIHDAIHIHSVQSESYEDYQPPSIPVVLELDRQLDEWRRCLPAQLQWRDDDVSALPIDSANPLNHDEQERQARYNTGLQMLSAELRTRFYHARSAIYRPFLFKALHFPQQVDSDDAGHCALAIESVCLWTITLAPAVHRKQLLPHLFTWTQNFLGALLLLYAVRHSDCLGRICDERRMSDDIQSSQRFMLRWIHDLREIYGTAVWSWQLLDPLLT